MENISWLGCFCLYIGLNVGRVEVILVGFILEGRKEDEGMMGEKTFR